MVTQLKLFWQSKDGEIVLHETALAYATIVYMPPERKYRWSASCYKKNSRRSHGQADSLKKAQIDVENFLLFNK